MNCVGKDTVLYPAHLPVVLPVHIAGNLAAACEETAMGKTEQDPPGETIFKAKPVIRISVCTISIMFVLFMTAVCFKLQT